MQQRQKGHYYGKLSQVNLKVTFTFRDAVAAATLRLISHLPLELWNRGASNHQDIQTKIQLGDILYT